MDECARATSARPYVSPRVSLSPIFFPSFSLCPSPSRPPTSHRMVGWAKDVCGSQGAPRRGRVPDKVTATTSAGFSPCSSPPFIFLLLPVSLHGTSLYLSPPLWQPSWAMRSVIERIRNNNKLSSPSSLTFHLPPPFCNLHARLDASRGAKTRDFAKRSRSSPFRDFPSYPSAIPLSAVTHLARDVSIGIPFAT